MSKKLKIHDGDTPGKAFEVKPEYPQPKVETMSNLKCPFCQQELEKRHAATTDYNSMFITYYCGNPECESTTDLVGCKEFWDILGQHIRTRKALDRAKWWLHEIVENHRYTPISTAEMALEEITALEQKDVR